MDGLDAQIALAQARLSSAVKSGEPADSPQVRPVDVRLERMRVLWSTHHRIRLELETSEGNHVSHVN